PRPAPAVAPECSGALALAVVDLLEIGVDHFLVAARGSALGAAGIAASLRAAVAARTCALAAALLGSGLIHGFADLHQGLQQGIGLGLDGIGVLAVHLGLERGDRAFDRFLVAGSHLVAGFLELLLGAVDRGVRVVAGLDQRAALLVVGGVRFGILHHLLDVAVAEAARGLDADLLFLVGRLVLGLDVDDAVGVDVERDL